MAANRNVVFGRINRRADGQDSITDRPFREEVMALIDSRRTEFVERMTNGRPMRRWVAADLQLTPSGDFVTGVLGYSEQQQHVSFDDDSYSWIKGAVEDADAASEQTIAPFALDLRDGQRWLAFATTARLQAQGFRRGLESVLNTAVMEVLGEMPGAWEVDLVTSQSAIFDWLRLNPRVHRLVRTVKFSNPGKDLTDDMAQMRALHANRKTEEFKAPYRGVLDVTSEAFIEKLDGTETGDLDVLMEARGERGVRNVKFNTRTSVDKSTIEEFGTNLQAGMDAVLAALREYVASKRAPQQPLLTEQAFAASQEVPRPRPWQP